MPKSRKNTEPTDGRKRRRITDSCDGDKIGERRVDVQPHPLLNHVVLEGVFPYLGMQDLMKTRLVCNFWHSTSLKSWRSLATVTIGPCSGDIASSTSAWPVNQFCEEFRDSKDFLQLAGKPFKKITLEAIDFQRCQMFQSSDVPDGRFNFWTLIGPLITHLHFRRCTFHGDSREVFGNILAEKLPNLDMLQLTDNNTSHVTGWHCLEVLNEGEYRTEADSLQISKLKTLKITGDVPMCVSTLVLNSPNLQTLQVGGFQGFDEYNTANRVKLQLDRTPCQLKHLDLMESLTNEFGAWRRSVPQQSPLEYLAFNVKTSSNLVEGRIIYYLAHPYANTLQVLKIFRSPANRVLRECPFNFDLPALRELHLLGNIVKTFGFLRYMPNLETLYVDYQCLTQTVSMENFYMNVAPTRRYIPFGSKINVNAVEWMSTSLEKMKFLHIDVEIHPRQISRLAELLPNLKTLRTVLQKTGFEQVCRHFPNLEELVLLFGSKTSKLWTDRSKPSVIVFSGRGKKEHEIVLKKLKRFELHALCDSSSDEFRINDKWVYQFLLKCPDLQHVYISASKLMTPGAEDALRKHVWNVTVIRGGKGDPEHDLKCKLCPQTSAKRYYSSGNPPGYRF